MTCEPSASVCRDSRPQADDYVVIDGYRLVKPYHFEFVCDVRQRWWGQSIIDAFSGEFPAHDRDYYQQALEDGRLRVDGYPLTNPDMPLENGMRVRHSMHLHEPPVPAGTIQVVGESSELVAVCKPAGMPVHAGGLYRKNTVLGILAAERPELGDLAPVHRLDKPVSGVLLFARHPAGAQALGQKIQSHTVEKVYVARVLGVFPATEVAAIVVDVPLAWSPAGNHVTAVPAAPGQQHPAAAAAITAAATTAAPAAAGPPAPLGAGAAFGPPAPQSSGTCCEQPGRGNDVAQQAQPHRLRNSKERRTAKLAKMAAHAEAVAGAGGVQQGGILDGRRDPKVATTEFRRLWVAPDGMTSLVECRPHTGRPHQIRVHLQWLGHPIANDTQYGGTYDYVPQQALQPPANSHNAAAAANACGAVHLTSALPAVAAGAPAADASPAPGAYPHSHLRSAPEFLVPMHLRGAVCCQHCPYYAPRGPPLDLRPLWLHAHTYSCQDGEWSFSCDLPDWAHQDYARGAM